MDCEGRVARLWTVGEGLLGCGLWGRGCRGVGEGLPDCEGGVARLWTVGEGLPGCGGGVARLWTVREGLPGCRGRGC